MEQVVSEIPASVPKEKRDAVIASLCKTDRLGEDVPFPSFTITATSITAQGSFAEKQAQYLSPPAAEVEELCTAIKQHNVGIVVHYYMDAQIQGLLTACAARFEAERHPWKPIFIADSLAMGDAALRMVTAGASAILCLGVDFMSENCRAVLDAAGHHSVPVYRLAREAIGCSLAAAADSASYDAWLRAETEAARAAGEVPVHVVYINTSLAAKARAQDICPTVACTSSNVVKTILQLAAQVGPERLRVLYGPDAYMGRNLLSLFTRIADAPDDSRAASAHPAHTRESVRAVAQRMRTFRDGYCLVHHLFSSDVVRRIRRMYGPERAYATAHLEVPGEMFEMALEAQSRGEGVVGATSDILTFITRTVEARLADPALHGGKPLAFLLGTESGMATSVVRRIQDVLRSRPGCTASVEIVFPVSSQAIAATGDIELPVVPGVTSGEGCSASGGCASCPYMKMNTLAALRDVMRRVGAAEQKELEVFRPKQYTERAKGGKSVATVGAIPILAMRYYQTKGEFSSELIDDIFSRA